MLNIKALSRSYSIARKAELAGAAKVDSYLVANYPAESAADDRKAFERKVMLPFEMARIIEKKQPGVDGVKLVTAFMSTPGYATKPEGGSDMFDAYRAAIVSVSRLLERAGVTERASTRKDKGETKGKRAARAAAKALAGDKAAPTEGAAKPVKVVANASNVVAPRLKAGEGVTWVREMAALIVHAGKKNADLTGDDGEAFRAFVAGVTALAKALPASK